MIYIRKKRNSYFHRLTEENKTIEEKLGQNSMNLK